MPCSLEIYPRLVSKPTLLRTDCPEGKPEPAAQSSGLIYRSEIMKKVFRLVEKVAACDISVLIEGETGTGKELVARAIHDFSARKSKPFLAQNTGALSDALIESELFGHRRGAFTGAVEDRPGLFEAAAGGSVFLDEIGEASSAVQVRLLRLLEAGTYRRLGENRDRTSDVRIIAATHRKLMAEVEAGNFREDLLYRLRVLPIHLPPLRERREDIPLLVEHFVTQTNRKIGTNVETIPSATLEHLMVLPWRGNVRELKNTVQRLVVLSTGKTLAAPQEPPPPQRSRKSDVPPSLRPIVEVEREHILRVLEYAGGNQSEAARILGLKRGTLRGRLKKLGIV